MQGKNTELWGLAALRGERWGGKAFLRKSCSSEEGRQEMGWGGGGGQVQQRLEDFSRMFVFILRAAGNQERVKPSNALLKMTGCVTEMADRPSGRTSRESYRRALAVFRQESSEAGAVRARKAGGKGKAGRRVSMDGSPVPGHAGRRAPKARFLGAL